jgi:hypothetical protein
MSFSSLVGRLTLGLLVLAALMAVPVPASGVWPRAYAANLPMPTPAAWNAPAVNPLGEPAAGNAGIGAYLDTGCPGAHVPRALSELERLPFSWARTEIPWAGVEPTPGTYQWERWDRVVDSLRTRDYRVLGMLCYWVSWVDPHSDAAIERFGQYAEAVARRYRGRVQAWEVWNEPNDRTFWQSTPERYVRLLQAAYEGVKRGDPEAIVVGGSLSGADLVYLRKLFTFGAGRWMDAVAIHPYSWGWAPESALLLEELRGIAQAVKQEGLPGGLWITEIGLSRSDSLQANLLERTCILLQQSGVVETWFWFCLYQGQPSGYALFRPDWRPQPSVAALDRVAQRLRDATPAGSGLPADLRQPWSAGSPHAHAPLQSWCFRTGGGMMRATWSPTGSVVIEAAPARKAVNRIPSWETLDGEPR